MLNQAPDVGKQAKSDEWGCNKNKNVFEKKNIKSLFQNVMSPFAKAFKNDSASQSISQSQVTASLFLLSKDKSDKINPTVSVLMLPENPIKKKKM